MTENKECNKHLITFDWNKPEFQEDFVTVYGICERCKRAFSATYSDMKFSVMEDGSDEWKDYEMLGTEMIQ